MSMRSMPRAMPRAPPSAQALRDRLRATYDRLTDTGGYTHRRRRDRPAVVAQCLPRYLVAGGDASAVALAKAQFDAGQNMTDVLAALGILSGVDCPERTDALAAFYASMARRSAGAGQMVRHPGAVATAGYRRRRCEALKTPSGLRPAQSEPDPRTGQQLSPATRCGSTTASGAGYRLTPTPSSSSTRPTARSRRGWSRRSGNGGASTPGGRR